MTQDVEENESVKPFGICLNEARKSLGLSLDELSRTLNLDIDILQALEDSDVDKLPPAIYVQGYIKAYTKALGISSEEIHADYLQSINRGEKAELRPRSPLPSETDSGTPIVKTFSILLGVLALSAVMFGVYNYYSKKVDIIEPVAIDENILPVQNEIIPIFQDAELTDDGELVVGGQSEQNIEEQADISDDFIEDQTSEAYEEPSAPKVLSSDDSLMIRATEESWAEIRDENKERIYFGMLKADDLLVLSGKAPFDIFLGNAINVGIEVNGVEVDMSDYVRINNIAHFKVSEKSNQIVFH